MAARRYLSLWLPRLAVDRLSRRGLPDGHAGAHGTLAPPVAVVQTEAGRLVILAVTPAAAASGVAPGMSLSDGRALCPDLAAADADLSGDRAALARLVHWCGRYTPWAAPDPATSPAEGGILMDITGCAHLAGGEAALAADMTARLFDFGLTVRLGVAGTVGAAWALARFGDDPVTIQPPQSGSGPEIRRPLHEALASLPVAGLRLPPAEVETLARLGLRRIGDLYGIPGAALAARFGPGIRRRLDQALGHEAEAISPVRPRRSLTVRRSFAEPLQQPEAMALVLDDLLVELCRELEAGDLGARRLTFTLCRADGSGAEARIGVSRPSRDPRHLARLFAPKLETLDPDPGIDTLALTAATAEPARPRQEDWRGGVAGREAPPRGAEADARDPGATPPDLAALVDRLANRLGAANVTWQAPAETPLPEGQAVRTPALAAPPPDWSGWGGPPLSRPPIGGPLPLRLLAAPEAVEPTGPFPADAGGRAPAAPPARFHWRGRLWEAALPDPPDSCSPGSSPPARVLGPWWRDDPTARDYHPAEIHPLDRRDVGPTRLWLFHDLATRRWHVHGVFG